MHVLDAEGPPHELHLCVLICLFGARREKFAPSMSNDGRLRLTMHIEETNTIKQKIDVNIYDFLVFIS